MGIPERRIALALSALTALALLAVRFAGRPAAEPAPVLAIAAVSTPLPSEAKPRPTPRRKVVEAVAPRDERGAGLREKGEAFGGTAPDRVDPSTPTARPRKS